MKKANKKTVLPKPEQMFGESSKAFRMRLIEWLIRSAEEPITYDQITDTVRQDPSITNTSKESVVRCMKILEQRGSILFCYDDDDGRLLLWYGS